METDNLKRIIENLLDLLYDYGVDEGTLSIALENPAIAQSMKSAKALKIVKEAREALRGGKTYKTVDELTVNQFEELRQMMVVDVENREGLTVPDKWYDECGDFTDEAVREFYDGTYFVDDDFTCTANGGKEVAA